MSRISDAVTLGVGPSADNFMKRAAAQIRSQKAPVIDIPLNPQLSRLRAELAAERARQSRNGIKIPVELDRRSMRRFDGEIRRIESVYKISEGKRALRIQVFVAGAAALPALTQGAASATAALTDLLRVSAQIPGLFSGIAAVVGTSAVGVRGIGAAFKAASEEGRNAAEKMRDFADATRNMEKAQRGVIDAVKDANRALEDQRDSLKGNRIDVERAAIRVGKANSKLREGGFKNVTEYREAILDQQEAVIGFNDAVKKNRRGLQDYFQAQQQGITKSDSVVSAMDRLADSVDKFGKAQSNVQGKSEKFLEAMAKLSPAAQAFVTQVRSMSGEWRKLQNAVQEDMFKGLGDSVVDLANKRLPMLRAGMQKVAQGINADLKQLISSVGSGNNSSQFAKIFENTKTALGRLTPGIDSLINAFVKMSEVGSRFLPRLSIAFNNVFGRFEKFIDKAAKDGSLEDWIDRGLKAWASLGNAVVDVGKIMGSITRAYETATGNVGGFVSTMERGLGKLADYLASPKGQQGMVKAISQAKAFIDQISESLPGIIDIFQAMGDSARAFAEFFFPIMSGVGKFLQEHLALVKWIALAYMSWRTVSPIMQGMTKNLNRLKSGMHAYRDSIEATRAADKRLTESIIENQKRAQKSQAKAAQARQRASRAERAIPAARAETAKLRNQELVYKRLNDMAQQEFDVEATRAAARARAGLTADQQAARARLDQTRRDFETQRRFTEQASRRGAVSRRGTPYSPAYIQGQQTALANRASEVERARQAFADAFASSDDGRLGSKMLQLQESTKRFAAAQSLTNDSVERYGKLQRTAGDSTAAAKGHMDRAAQSIRAVDVASSNLSTSSVKKASVFSRAWDSMRGGIDRVNDAHKRLASGGIRELTSAWGAGKGSGGGLMGRIGGLMGALGGWAIGGAVGAIGSVGLVAALWKLAEAHDKAAARADYHAERERALKNQLDETTGAVTRASLNQSAESAQKVEIRGNHNDKVDRNSIKDAQQLGINLDTYKLSFDPTQLDAVATVNKAADDSTRAGIVAGLDDQWTKKGGRLTDYGFTLDDYVKAVNGDQASVQKFNDTVTRMGHDDGLRYDWMISAAQAVGDLPNLGSGAANLARAGVAGVSVGQFSRETRDFNTQFGDAAKERTTAKKLTEEGARIFGVRDAMESVDGEGVGFTVDNITPEVAASWRTTLGVGVKQLGPNGRYAVNITGDENLHKFVQGFASGGPVWGAGSARSDSIPAMLSNGEYVINAKSAQAIGHGTLDRLNNAPREASGGRYAPGGPVIEPIPPWQQQLIPALNAAGINNSNPISASDSTRAAIGAIAAPKPVAPKLPGDPGFIGPVMVPPLAPPLAPPKPVAPPALPPHGAGGGAGPGGPASTPGVPGSPTLAAPVTPARILPPGFPSYDSLPGPASAGSGAGAGLVPGLSPILPTAAAPSSPASSAPASTLPNSSALSSLLNSVQAGSPGKYGVSYMPLFGDNATATSFGELTSGAAWSTMKLPLALAVMQKTGAVNPDIIAAITNSDNAAADRLWASLGSPAEASAAVQAVLSSAGDPTLVNYTKARPEFSAFGQTDWSMENQLKFIKYLSADPKNAPLLDLMGNIQSDQKWGLGQVAGAKFKGGWGPGLDGKYLSRQMGIIDGPGGKYAVAIEAQPDSGTLDGANSALSNITSALAPELGKTVPNGTAAPAVAAAADALGLTAPGGSTSALKSFAESVAGRVPYDWGGFGPGQEQFGDSLTDGNKGGFDCSGLALAFANIAQGKPWNAGGRNATAAGQGGFSTNNEGAELTARGFKPGAGGMGTLTIGWSDSHTGITLPDGTHIDAQNSDSGIVMGEGSNGATGFPNVMHLPISDSGVPDIGGTLPDGTPMYYIPPEALSGYPSGVGPDGAIAGGIPGFPNGIPGITTPLMGPYGKLPVQPMDLIKQVGGVLMDAVFGFFGIDTSSITGTANAIISGIGDMNKNKGDQSVDEPAIPGVDLTAEPEVQANQLLAMAGEAKKAGRDAEARQYYEAALQVVNNGIAADKALTAAGGDNGGNSGPPSASYSGGTPDTHNAVYKAFKEAGFEDEQWAPLVELINHENDTWDPSRPTGGPNSDASGIFQFLSDTWQTVGMEPSVDPYTQAVAGMKYIKGRYQNPKGAWDAWQAQLDSNGHHWYADGGHVRGPGSGTSDSIPAMLSNGEYVLRAKAVQALGVGRLNAMNKYADGGLVLPWLDPAAETGPPPGPDGAAPIGPTPDAAAAPAEGPVPAPAAAAAGDIAGGLAAAAGGVGAGVDGAGGLAGGAQPDQADSRSTLGAAPTSDSYINPALSGAIQGAFSAAGSIANTAVQAGTAAATMGGSMAAGGMGAGQAGSAIQAGSQIAGMVATGAANVLSAALVGTATPAKTGQGYGAPLTAPVQQNPVSNFQSIHNGNIVTNNLEEYSRLKDRKDAQKSVPFMNRVGS